MRLRLLILLFVPSVFSLNILMYVKVIGKSHIQYAEKIIALLNENGHTVDAVLGMFNTYVTVKGNYGARTAVAVHFPGESPWGGVYHLNDPFKQRSDWDRVIYGQSLKFLETCSALCDHLLDSYEVADLLSTNNYDLALISGYDYCPFAIAHHYNIKRVVSYVPTPLYYFQTYNGGLPELPLYENVIFDTRHAERSSFPTRMYETFRTFRERLAHYMHYLEENKKVHARFGKDFPDVKEIARNTAIDFTNSHPLLEEPRPMSLRLRYIGGVGLPKQKPLTKEMDELLGKAKKGNIIFSFGTQIGPEKFPQSLREIFINTFKRFPDYNFLWKFDGKTSTNASNVFNMDWLPQTDLLHDSRVVAFISHMGLNSFTETSAAGVPIIALPLFTDQVHNARRARALSTAEIVTKTEISEENLSNALEKVLHDQKYGIRAKEVAAMMAVLPDTPQRIFLEGIEFAAKFDNLASHYRLAGAEYHFVVQNGWDVAAFLTLVVLLVVFIFVKLVFLLVKILISRIPNKNKAD